MTTGTLMGIWAHPDDEVYLSAGLMAAARRRGDRVVMVTATAGEQGTDDPVRWPPRRLAAHRRRELRSSLAAVGVTELHLLGYADGGCHLVDGTPRISELVRRVRPDTIVTFGPDGMTGHPDHVAVSAWATAAWREAAGTARLWYATLTPAFHARWGGLNGELGIWAYTDQPPCTDPDDLAHLLELDDSLLDQKMAAFRAHASQTTGLMDLVGEATFRAWWSTEAFADAAVPAAPGPGAARRLAPCTASR
jgi:LmbE family N-acetylglucosaminyl deacetylase